MRKTPFESGAHCSENRAKAVNESFTHSRQALILRANEYGIVTLLNRFNFVGLDLHPRLSQNADRRACGKYCELVRKRVCGNRQRRLRVCPGCAGLCDESA